MPTPCSMSHRSGCCTTHAWSSTPASALSSHQASHAIVTPSTTSGTCGFKQRSPSRPSHWACTRASPHTCARCSHTGCLHATTHTSLRQRHHAMRWLSCCRAKTAGLRQSIWQPNRHVVCQHPLVKCNHHHPQLAVLLLEELLSHNTKSIANTLGDPTRETAEEMQERLDRARVMALATLAEHRAALPCDEKQLTAALMPLLSSRAPPPVRSAAYTAALAMHDLLPGKVIVTAAADSEPSVQDPLWRLVAAWATQHQSRELLSCAVAALRAGAHGAAPGGVFQALPVLAGEDADARRRLAAAAWEGRTRVPCFWASLFGQACIEYYEGVPDIGALLQGGADDEALRLLAHVLGYRAYAALKDALPADDSSAVTRVIETLSELHQQHPHALSSSYDAASIVARWLARHTYSMDAVNLLASLVASHGSALLDVSAEMTIDALQKRLRLRPCHAWADLWLRRVEGLQQQRGAVLVEGLQKLDPCCQTMVLQRMGDDVDGMMIHSTVHTRPPSSCRVCVARAGQARHAGRQRLASPAGYRTARQRHTPTPHRPSPRHAARQPRAAAVCT